jgi:hypothetical protein
MIYTHKFITSYSEYAQYYPLKTQLNPICHSMELLGAHHILHVSRIRVKGLHKNILSLCSQDVIWSKTCTAVART